MSSADDSTTVVRMRQDFEEFIAKSGSSGHRHRVHSLHSSAGSSFLETSSHETTAGHVTMQQIFEKEKQERLKRAELMAAKGQIAALEGRVEELETSRKRARIEWERDQHQEREEYRHKLDKLNEVTQQLHLMIRKDEETREELMQCRQRLESSKAIYEQRVLQLQKEKLTLEADLQEVQQTSSSMQTELKSDMMRQKAELEIRELEAEEVKAQLSSALKRCSESSRRIAELEEVRLEALAAEHKIKELELQLARVEEDAIVTKAMKSELSAIQKLERENKKLQEENEYRKNTEENTLLLQEKVEGLQRKLERSEERCRELSALQIQNQELQERLTKWEAAEQVQSSTGKVSSPEILSQLVSQLQSSNALLLEKQGSLQTSLHLTKEAAATTEAKLNSLQRESLQEKHQAQQHKEFIKRLQRKLLLVTKERDGYKSIITQYESEATITLSSQASTRLQQLEETVNSYHKQLASVENELQAATKQMVEFKTKAEMAETRVAQLESQHKLDRRTSLGEVDRKQLADLRERIAQLEKQLEAAVMDKEILEGRLERHNLQGDYDPTKTKVLHFEMNPAAIAQQKRAKEVATLQAENERLRQRLAVLEEAGKQPMQDLTMQVEERLQQPGPSSKHVEEVKSQLASSELKNKRLMEVFKKTSQEFREVVYQLLGYRIDIPCANQYRLMNMYSESPNDFLLFQQGPEGGMQVLSTDYSSTLTDKTEMYLETYNSIPAFLSSVTLDLHGRQTMLQ